MEDVNLSGRNYSVMVLETLIELHAKQNAQSGLIIEFLSSVSKIPAKTLHDNMLGRIEHAKKEILKSLYSDYGQMPKDVQDWMDNQLKK